MTFSAHVWNRESPILVFRAVGGIDIVRHARRMGSFSDARMTLDASALAMDAFSEVVADHCQPARLTVRTLGGDILFRDSSGR
jgi:hypothetical protein